MRRIFAIGATAVLVAVVVASVVSAASRHERVSYPLTIKVVERPTTDEVIDTGGPGDTAGDLLTFHNAIYDATNTDRVGRDQGDCIRIDPSKGSWECRWITWLPDGALTVEGPFFDTHGSVFAITGGTGKFRNAQGTMTLKFRDDGDLTFVFNVIP